MVAKAAAVAEGWAVVGLAGQGSAGLVKEAWDRAETATVAQVMARGATGWGARAMAEPAKGREGRGAPGWAGRGREARGWAVVARAGPEWGEKVGGAAA